MRITLMGSIVALAVASTFGLSHPAVAAGVSVSIDAGNVAFGYSDGYWDRGHQWHSWSPAQAKEYRSHNKEHYVAHRHDREKDGGYHKEWWH